MKLCQSLKKKTWRYILIDIVTSTFVFLSFVFFKEGYLKLGLLFFTSIPFGILWYKWKNKSARLFFIWYSNIGLLLSLGIYYLIEIDLHSNETILAYSLLSSTTYLYFISIYYVKKCKKIDEGVMAKESTLYLMKIVSFYEGSYVKEFPM